MITDLFSHKIHSSGEEWPEKLVEIAGIFGDFDGQLYDPARLKARLTEISPRSAYAIRDVRDVSKFRDEISAYSAYLGVFHLRWSPEGWRVALGGAARQFLVCEEPDVGAFLRVQLPLLQFPNGSGAQFYPGTNRLRLQANATGKTLEYIRDDCHLSPLRLVVSALYADSAIRGCSICDAGVTYSEIFALANSRRIFRFASPPAGTVERALEEARGGRLRPPPRYERRLHLLNHLELFRAERGQVRVRDTVSDSDRKSVEQKLGTISNIKAQFRGMDGVSNREQLVEAIAQGAWWDYFDGLRTLDAAVVSALAEDEPLSDAASHVFPPVGGGRAAPGTYNLRELPTQPPPPPRLSRRDELADPEMTRIKRQRRSLAHKRLVAGMADCLRAKGATPLENPHIDLVGKIPDDGTFLFEMKSGGENLLDQIRKGISQLYEYKYRYRAQISGDVRLCLVLTKRPDEIPWIEDYLFADRGISLCWLDEAQQVRFPDSCRDTLRDLLPPA